MPPQRFGRHMAIGAILRALRAPTADDATLRRTFCAVLGHPKLVRLFLGEVSCALCGALLGDTLVGTFSLTDYAVVGHDCAQCRTAIAHLSPNDCLLLPDEVRAFVAAMRLPATPPSNPSAQERAP